LLSVIHVILVTGFLGSGKTTFLNHAISAFPKDLRIAVLINEFADIGIDSALLKSREGMEIVEVSKGSIFCICAKKDFLLGLAQIADRVAPDLLLIEATGVANPQDIRKDLAQDIFKKQFSFLSQICLVDTPNFEAAYHVYNAVEKQIASSDVFVLNKMDFAEPEQVRITRNLISAHRPDPVIIEAEYAHVPVESFVEEIRRNKKILKPADDKKTSDFSLKEVTAAQIESLANGGMAPADALSAAVYIWKGSTQAEITSLFQAFPESVLRVKGLIRVDKEIRLLNRVMGAWQFDPLPQKARATIPEVLNRIAVIAPTEAIDWIEQNAVPHLLEKESAHDPVSIMNMMPMPR
jgi:G3E family GTPase